MAQVDAVSNTGTGTEVQLDTLDNVLLNTAHYPTSTCNFSESELTCDQVRIEMGLPMLISQHSLDLLIYLFFFFF